VTPRLNAISGEHGEERPDVACLLRAGEVEEAVHLVVGFLFGLGADAAVLGLRSASELVREGLRLVHRQARELAMAASYDEFYAGKPAPVSEVTAALWPE
jgi:hypothetical protein